MDIAPIHFGCQIITYGDVENTIRYSLLAEKSDFDTITFPDHLFHPLTKGFLEKPAWEVFTMLSAIGLRTTRVKLMPAVADSVRRHPALLAQTMATLDQLTNGRAMLGIGAGEVFNFAPLKDIKWDKPFKRLRETIEVIKLLWESTKENPVTFEGEFFKVEDAHLGFKPKQKPNPPIYIGGYGPRMRRLVGTHGDGWIPWLHSPETYGEDLRLIVVAARNASRNVDEIDTAVMVPTVVSEDADEAWKIAMPRNRISLALRTKLLRDLGYPNLADELINMWRMAFNDWQIRRLREIAGKIPFEAVEAITVAGTADDAIEGIADYARAGVKNFIAIPLIPRFEETVRLYKDEIIPYFKGK